MKSSQLPEALHIGYGQVRGNLKQLFADSGKNMKTEGGVEALADKKIGPQPTNLFDTLAQYGVFVVRKGEMESWLRSLNIPGKKTDWTIAMLEALGSDPGSPTYVQPTSGDVWDFIRSIVAWVRNPARKGTN